MAVEKGAGGVGNKCAARASSCTSEFRQGDTFSYIFQIIMKECCTVSFLSLNIRYNSAADFDPHGVPKGFFIIVYTTEKPPPSPHGTRAPYPTTRPLSNQKEAASASLTSEWDVCSS